MAVSPPVKFDLNAVLADRRNWILPLLGTAASLAFAAAITTTLRILRGFAKARESAFDPPQAILVLGGDKEREHLAAKFAASCGERSFSRLVSPEAHAASLRLLPVYVSSGHDDASGVMLDAGVHPSRLVIDNRALDTVTNFTTMLTSFRGAGYSHVLLVTSDYHVRRAAMVATLVLCSHGIAFTAVVLPSRAKQEAGAAAAKGKQGKNEAAAKQQEAAAKSDAKKVPEAAGARKGKEVKEWPEETEAKKAAGLNNKPVPVPRASARHGRRLDSKGGTPLALSPRDHQSSSIPEIEETTSSLSQSDSVASSASTPRSTQSAVDSTATTPRTRLPRPSELAREAAEEAAASLPDDQIARFDDSPVEPEGRVRLERDRLRALLWLVSGWHGAELLRFTRPTRYRLHKQKPLHPDVVATKED